MRIAFCGKRASDPVGAKDEWVGWHFTRLLCMVHDAPGHMER